MATYVYRGGQMVNKATGEPMLTDAERTAPLALPQRLSFEPYACPITGKPITTPEQHRDNLKKHDCVEAKELPQATGGEIRNAAWAKKRGMKVSDRYMDEPFKRPERV